MDNDMMIIVKNRITKIMEAKGLKRYTLAEKAGISHPTIQNWYSKRDYAPSFYSMDKITKALDITLAQLFLREDEDMYPMNKELKDFVENYQSLSHDDKKVISDLVKRLKRS